jgi:hypothetical protein
VPSTSFCCMKVTTYKMERSTNTHSFYKSSSTKKKLNLSKKTNPPIAIQRSRMWLCAKKHVSINCCHTIMFFSTTPLWFFWWLQRHGFHYDTIEQYVHVLHIQWKVDVWCPIKKIKKVFWFLENQYFTKSSDIIIS